MAEYGISLRASTRIAWWLPWWVRAWRAFTWMTGAEPTDETISRIAKRAVKVKVDAVPSENP